MFARSMNKIFHIHCITTIPIGIVMGTMLGYYDWKQHLILKENLVFYDTIYPEEMGKLYN